MAEGGAAPPPEAMRGKGVSSAIVIIVAVVTFLAGLGVGSVFLGARAPPAKTTLVVAVQAPFPPFMDFNSSRDVGFEGFEVDIVELIAANLSRILVFRQYSSFPTLQAETGKNAVDMASASITITVARNATMDFSDGYFRSDQGFLVRKQSTFACANNLCTPQVLADKIIAVQQGTTSEDWLNTNVKPLMANPTTQLKVFQKVEELIAALTLNTVDVVMIDSVTAKDLAGPANSLFKLAGIVVTNEDYGFAVANNDPQGLIPVINRVLAQLRASGAYQALIDKWFEFGV